MSLLDKDCIQDFLFSCSNSIKILETTVLKIEIIIMTWNKIFIIKSIKNYRKHKALLSLSAKNLTQDCRNCRVQEVIRQHNNLLLVVLFLVVNHLVAIRNFSVISVQHGFNRSYHHFKRYENYSNSFLICRYFAVLIR